MCEVPAYLRAAPLDGGQQAISRLSNPAADAHWATSLSDVSGKGAVRKPSLIEDPPGA